MPKRFTDSELDDKEWFMTLSCRLKCAVQYLFRKCDATGVWEPNYILATAYVGEGGFTEQEILSIDGGKQFEKLPNGKIYLPGFCDFQYGVLTETCRPHRPIIQKLKKHGLYERVLIEYQKGTNTLEEKEKDKDKEQEKEQEQEIEGGAGETLDPVVDEPFSITPEIQLPANTLESAELNQFTLTGSKNTEFLKGQWSVFVSERIHDPPEQRRNFRQLSDLTKFFLNWIRNKHPKNAKRGTNQTGRSFESD